ncbi:endonuclease I family protein [Turneriella parva]|uniref:Endonuclease I n=1 Tax=Turneriella parva (strain ATCC BAA-1111 / DSM 21527 / NCTC 11395 / H) TaxID=869212 RepID=I4B3B9_TURPD|nr:endonuclease [Turneriella parva]AFM11776.1 Endonuclease I [Turneriella parva DSM 21527]
MHIRWLRAATLGFLVTCIWPDGNISIANFRKAKQLVYQIAAPENRTFYCNCAFSAEGIDRASCGYVPLNDNARANRTEIEHIVPAENFGKSFAEWRDGHADCVRTNGTRYKGRRCAGKASATYRLMEADLYNLVPEIGELNADRRNYRFGIIEGEARNYGACDFEVEDRVTEPRPEIRGDIARVYFYMNAAYPGRGIIGNKAQKLFEAWDKADPVDAVECRRAAKIEHVQGNANEFVKQPCAAAGLY